MEKKRKSKIKTINLGEIFNLNKKKFCKIIKKKKKNESKHYIQRSERNAGQEQKGISFEEFLLQLLGETFQQSTTCKKNLQN